MRLPIIDTTRSVTFVRDCMDFAGFERDIWSIVINCPVDGTYLATTEYFETLEEAQQHAKTLNI